MTCDKTSTFGSHKVGHVVTGRFEQGGRRVKCDKISTSNPRRRKNTSMDQIGVRMSQGRIVTADSLLSG